MRPVWLIMLVFAALTACAGNGQKPEPDAFSKNLTLFSHGGYQFAARLRGRELRVKVPCCQTYVADIAFRKLMLEAVEKRMGCAPAAPVFTDGWTGRWQMRARFACEDAARHGDILGEPLPPLRK